jgi:hypothetical protein
MTQYNDPFEHRFEAKIKDLGRRLAAAEQQIANASMGAFAVTSATHPANPATGMRIYETDTGLEAYWNGSGWVYPRQLIAKSLLSGTAPSIPFSVPAGPAFSTLRVVWSARGDNASPATFMCVQLNGDTAARYVWQDNQANVATPGPAGSGGATTLIEVGTLAAASAASGYVGGGEFGIPNASGSTFKTVSGSSTSMNALANGYSGTYGGLWAATAAVSSLTLFPLSGNLVAGSAAYLYGET